MRIAVSGLLATVLLAGLVPAATTAAEAATSRSAAAGRCASTGSTSPCARARSRW